METLRHLDRRTLALGGLVLVTVLFLAVNVFSNMTFRSWQLDLTEEKLFTLSDGTRSVLASIDEPIDVRLYYTKLLGERSPVHATYFVRARELLERYGDLSGGKVRLELHNPEPFSDTEDRAVAFGLQGIPVNAAGDLGYFGLAATNSTDDEAVIPYFSPEREAFLEYDLTRLIYSLAHPKMKMVGLISSLPIDEGRAGPFAPGRRWAVMDQIRELFAVRSLAGDIKAIPDSVDILMLVHPKGLTEKALYAIDQFVLGGGRALVFVDPNAESEGMRGRGFGAPGASDFNRILEAWGVRLVKDKVAGDLDTARRVNVNQRGRVDVVDYVLWLSLAPGNFDTGDVVTGDVNRLNVATPGILEKVDGRGTEVSALLSLGPRSMRIDANKIRVGADAVALFRDFRPGGEELMLAARLTGPAKSAFPDGPPAAEKATGSEAQEAGAAEAAAETDADAAGAAEHLSESITPVNVIVVADSDMLRDDQWVTSRDFFGQRLLVPSADNANFVVNALENLSGSGALIGLRGRGESARPFALVETIRQEAERRYRAKEQELREKLSAVQGKLDRLVGRQGAKGEVILSADDKATIDRFRRETVSIRRELRGVQRALRKDIDRLDAWLKFFNIAAIPLLLVAVTLVVAVIRRVRRRPDRANRPWAEA